MLRHSLSPVEPVADRAVAFRSNAMSHFSHDRPPNADYQINGFLEPEFLLPVQYNGLLRKRAFEAGESRLLLAVLKDALRSYLKNINARTAQARRDFEETSHWFYAQGQEGIFAFEQLCEALGIEPGPLRRWLKSLHSGSSEQSLHRSTPRY